MGHPSVAQLLESTVTLPKRNGAALQELLLSFHDGQPLAILIGEGSIVARTVIDAFAAEVDEYVDVVRLTGSSLNPERCLGTIVRGLGFEPDGLALDDLRQILAMFLEYQRKHRRRTVFCVEDAQDAGDWTLDLLNDLVEVEMRKRYGLFLLLAGAPPLQDNLDNPQFQALASGVHPRISIAPFELEETRGYLQERLRGDGQKLISAVFEFDAVTRVHEISAGVPDTVDRLVDQCLQKVNGKPLTVDMVDAIARTLQLVSSNDEDEDEILFAELGVPTGGRLIVRRGGKELARRTIDKERLLIGRSRRSDLRLASETVSRSHAAILWTRSGVSIVDLGSTNGTTVDGERIQSHILSEGLSVRVGDCELEYVGPTTQQN